MANEQHQERLYRLMSDLGAIIKDLWSADGGVDELIELTAWSGRLAELEKDMRSEVMG